MKTLYIMRHPHKEDSTQGNDDFDIKLSSSGIEQAHLMAKKLIKKGVCPDLIVASPSSRTRETAEILSQEFNHDKNIMYNEVLYNAFVNELIETISYTFDTVEHLLIVGHNPSLTALTITLGLYNKEIKPAEVVKVEFDIDSWINIDKNNARLGWVETLDET